MSWTEHPLSHLNKIPALLGSLSFVEVGGLSLAAAVQLAAKAVMESPHILALHWKYLSKCQDLTIYPHMRPLGRCYLPDPMEKGYVFMQLVETWNKEQRTHPAMIYADPLPRIKTASLNAFPH